MYSNRHTKGSRSRKLEHMDTDAPLFRKKRRAVVECARRELKLCLHAEVEAQRRRCCCCCCRRRRIRPRLGRYRDHSTETSLQSERHSVVFFTSSHMAALRPQIQFSHSTLQIISIIQPPPKKNLDSSEMMSSFGCILYLWLVVE